MMPGRRRCGSKGCGPLDRFIYGRRDQDSPWWGVMIAGLIGVGIGQAAIALLNVFWYVFVLP